MPHLKWVFPILWFVVKTSAFAFAYVWFRASLPRFRYDQLMDLGLEAADPAQPGLDAGRGRVPRQPGVGLRRWPPRCCWPRIVLGRAFDLGTGRERGADAVLPAVGERPLPGEVLRAHTDEEEG